MYQSFCCLLPWQKQQKQTQEQQQQLKPQKITKSMLNTGSITRSKSSKRKSQIFFQTNFLGSYMPYYKNDKAEELWLQVINNLEEVEEVDTFETLPALKKQNSLSNVIYYQQLYKCQFINNEEDIILVKLLHRTKEKFLRYQIIENSKRFLLTIGPPIKYRWATWKTLLLLEKSTQVGMYERMIEKESPHHDNIMKDVDRTFITHQLFKSEGSESQIGQQYLARILDAVANTLPSIGYCQGMNFLTGLLLIVSAFDEKHIYSSLISLLLSPSHLLYFLYNVPMPLYDIFLYIIHEKLKFHFPDIELNLQKNQIPDTIWLSKMILTLFLYNFELSDSLRVWDYIIARGAIRAIPELVLSIIYQFRERLSTCTIEKFAILFASSNEEIKLKIVDTLYFAKEKYEILKKEIVEILQNYNPTSQSHKDLLSVLSKFQNKKDYEAAVEELVKGVVVIKL